MGNKVLIVLGMSRSYTALLSNWLNKCGIPFGIELVPGDGNNFDGYFEDSEILNLQTKILKRNYNSSIIRVGIKTSHQIKFIGEDLKNFKTIVEIRNQQFTQWAFKEPTSALFWGQWNTLLPDAKLLIVYRDYKEVIESIYKFILKSRSNRFPLLGKIFKLRFLIFKKYYLNRFLEAWIRHYSDILAFTKIKKK